ncbi:MAG: hypothetical protein R3Y11_09540 [Pseudomonadota bacterium]
MAKAKKETEAPEATAEPVNTEQTTDQASKQTTEQTADVASPIAPEASEIPDSPEADKDSSSITSENEAEVSPDTPSPDAPSPEETAQPHPYAYKPETNNKCPYCNITLARIPPDKFNPETNGTYYRQSCPSCPYVERVDTETNRVFYVEWPIHK